jgi:uncharacterized membrane protein HdeD (DUF308 family)
MGLDVVNRVGRLADYLRVATGSPFLAALVVNVVIAWFIVLAGVVHLVLAVHGHGAVSLIWKLLVGLACLYVSVYLGFLSIVLFFRMRSVRGSSWVMVDGIVTLLLELLIYLQRLSSSVWVIGILVGSRLRARSSDRFAQSEPTPNLYRSQ